MKRRLFAFNALAEDLKAGKNDVSTIFGVFTDRKVGDCDKAISKHYIDIEKETDFIQHFKLFLNEWKQGDQLIFYYSGHGVKKNGIYCLKFVDGLVPWQSILDKVKINQVNKAIFILDACYSGNTTNGNHKGIEDIYNIDKLDLPDGYLFLASSKDYQRSSELEDKSSSVFTELFVEALTSGLNGVKTKDGYIRYTHLKDYIDKQMTTPKYKSYSQTPQHKVKNAAADIWIAKNRSGRIETSITPDRSKVPPLHLSPNLNVSIEDLDKKVVDRVYEANFKDEPEASFERRLKKLKIFSLKNLGGGIHKAAIIFFCKNPSLFYSYLKTTFYVGEKLAPEIRESINGHIEKQVKEITKKIEDNLSGDVFNYETGDRVPVYDSEDKTLVREILLNAFLHRNYENENVIIVQVIRNPNYAIRIENPGNLPDEWKTLLERGLSEPINSEIYHYAESLKLFERQGRGTTLIREYLEKYGTDAIICDTANNRVSIKINLKSKRFSGKTKSNSDNIPKSLTTFIPQIEDPTKIIGRGKDLENLRQVLTQKQRAVVVNGLGGIGKTTLAQAYLTQYAGEYAHILWLTQSEGDNLALDLLTAPGLTQNLRINTDGKDAQALFTEIIATLKSITDQPNLWVIDNANASLHRYFDYLPQPPNWHILVTSRERIERFEPINLDFLPPDDALQLFITHCQRLTDETALKQLLKTIDYHTLTIEILAKTAQQNDTPLTTLQQAIEKDLKTGVYIRHSTDRIERVTSYLLSIFELHAHSPQAQNLLQHFTALPTEYIPYERLKTLIPAGEEGIAPTLQDLTDKGWLLYQSEPESYKMHRIIQEVVKRKLPPTVAGLQGLIEKVTRLLSINQTKDNPVHKFPFIPFGEAVLSLFPHETDTSISPLQNNLATVLQAFGDYQSAKTLLQKAITSDEENFGPNHPTTAVRYSNLATVLQALGDYAGAKTLLEKTMLSMETNFGKDHPYTAQSYSNLAMVLKDLGDYADAKTLLQKAMKSNEENFGPNHPTTAVRYSNLATVLQTLGDYAGAKTLLEKAMKSDEENFGPNHPTTAVSYSNLAMVLKDLGDYTGAKTLLQKAIKSAEENFGPNHPTTAVSYSNLATVYYETKNYENALTYIVKAYRIYATHLGQQHPNTKIIEGNLNFIANEMLQNGYTEEAIQKLLTT